MTSPLEPVLQAAWQHALRYRLAVARAPQRPRLAYHEAHAALAQDLPEQGEAGLAVIEDLVRRAEPGLHASTGPRFFGWVIGQSHPVGVAADWLCGAWGQNAGNHVAAPAAAACETVAAGWLLKLLDLPDSSSVGFVTGGTLANFTCLAAARGEVLRRHGWDLQARGLFGAPPITVLIGADAHVAVHAALQMLGFGHAQLSTVASDAQGRMLPEALRQAVARVRGPAIAILQAGQIHTGDFDPAEALVPLARQCQAWVHVDGAFGLWARACPERQFLARGLELADSWAVDGHKWLQTPYDSGYAIVRDADAHARAMAVAASYLPPSEGGDRDPSHFVPELSRRARGFATYALIRHLGRQGIAAMVERHCRLARRLADRLRAEPGVAILNEVVLNQVAVRFGADRADAEGDRLTQATVHALQRDGTCYAGGARWRGRDILRLSVINFGTTEDDIDLSAAAILAAWRSAAGQGA